jgi:hypothetical protein
MLDDKPSIVPRSVSGGSPLSQPAHTLTWEAVIRDLLLNWMRGYFLTKLVVVSSNMGPTSWMKVKVCRWSRFSCARWPTQ